METEAVKRAEVVREEAMAAAEKEEEAMEEEVKVGGATVGVKEEVERVVVARAAVEMGAAEKEEEAMAMRIAKRRAPRRD